MIYDGNADKTAVMLVLSGNSEAYGHIVHRYKGTVFNTIYAIIKNYHTAEDLTQDTFIDGYIKLKSLGEPYNVSAWLVKMAKNKCYNYLTRSAVKFESELYDYIPDIRISAPENFLIEQQERETLKQAVGRLPELYKTVTELYYFQNYSQNKIAELLKIPIGTVSRRLYDARLKLKKEFENMSENITVNKNFEKQVAEKIKAIQNYYSLHNYSYDGFDSEFKEAVELIEKLPESQEKHAAYADIYLAASRQDKKHQDRVLQEAELSEKAQVIANIMFDEYIHNYDEYIKKSSEAINKIKKMPENLDNANAIGELLFWRGSRKFIQSWENECINKLNEAKTDFIEAEKNLRKTNPYYPNAIAGIKAVDIEKNDTDKYIKILYSITGERYKYHNGKLTFEDQPGFGSSCGINNYNSIPYYVSWNFDRTFFDENLEIGGKIIETKGEYTKSAGSTHTLISKNEKVSVLTGTFDDCMHIKLHGLFFSKIYDADVYYAKGVGLVKAEFVEGDKIENYELCEYKINNGNAGSEYFPFAVGNAWKYVNTNLSPIYWQTQEYELINIDTVENEGVYVNFSAVEYLRLTKIDGFSDDCDSDTYIHLADKALPNEKPEKWDFETAIKYLKFAVQKNSSVKATLFASNAIEFEERCAGYYKKGWHFLPSGERGSKILKNKVQDKIIYKESDYTWIGPYVMWGSWYGARRCIGLHPLRFLQTLAGTLYSDKWIAGYSEQLKNEDGEIYLKVENGGTVITKAGTFDNCIKVTFDLEWEGGKDDGLYYLHNLRYSHCGTKIYWYAPNVGIVRHDCIWGDAISSSIELTEYKSCATNGEYMPIYVGNRWIYDETTIGTEFIARKKYYIISGMEEEFFMIEEQEMVFMGTDEEYEAFKKTRKK